MINFSISDFVNHLCGGFHRERSLDVIDNFRKDKDLFI